MLMNFWQFCLSNWQGLRPVWTISVCFVDKGLLVWAFPQLHKLKFSCYLKCSKILAFCFLFVWLIKLKMYPSSISQLGFFQGIICNIEGWKGWAWSPELPEDLNWWGGGVVVWGGWFKRGDVRPLFIPWLYLAWDQDKRPKDVTISYVM